MPGLCPAAAVSDNLFTLCAPLESGADRRENAALPTTVTQFIAEGRWRKRDSNSRSLREGKGYGEPLQASIAVSGLNLVSGSTFRAAVSEWQERDRWFESGSLHQRVGRTSQPRRSRPIKSGQGLQRHRDRSKVSVRRGKGRVPPFREPRAFWEGRDHTLIMRLS